MRAARCDKVPRIFGPPKYTDSAVRLRAHSRASALMVATGMPVISEAQAGVFSTPSSLPSTCALNSSKPRV